MSRPTYDELLAMYFNAERARIAEWSGDIRGETLELWRRCCEWADVTENLPDAGGLIQDYLEMEREEQRSEERKAGRRHLSDVLKAMLVVVPNSEAEFRDQLEHLRSTSVYQPPEVQGALWNAAADVLEHHFGPPPLKGWREEARKLFMGEAMVES